MRQDIRIMRARAEDRGPLSDLFANYAREMAGPEWDDALRDRAWRFFDTYWTGDERRRAHLIEANGRPVGFALLNDHSQLERPTDHAVAEFGVAPDDRRRGIGLAAALQLLGTYEGQWEVATARATPRAEAFWTRVVHAAHVSELHADRHDNRTVFRFRTQR